ncbi:hypothetical protein D3C75_901860 [compost metagenome]
MCLSKFQHLTLGQQRMEFDLVDYRHHSGVIDNILQMMSLKVADADRFDQPFLLQMDQRFPGIPVFAGHWPMDQVQINYIQPQLLPADLEGFQR